MDEQKSLQTVSDQAIEQTIVESPEGLPMVESKLIWVGWRYVYIVLGILIELMSVGLFIFLIVIIPQIDMIAIVFLCVPFITFAGGFFVIRGTRWLRSNIDPGCKRLG